MIIKIRTNQSWKISSCSQKNLEHTFAHKYLFSIYIIQNYIIYRSVSYILHFRDYTYLCVRIRVVSVSVSLSMLHSRKLSFTHTLTIHNPLTLMQTLSPSHITLSLPQTLLHTKPNTSHCHCWLCLPLPPVWRMKDTLLTMISVVCRHNKYNFSDSWFSFRIGFSKLEVHAVWYGCAFPLFMKTSLILMSQSVLFLSILKSHTNSNVTICLVFINFEIPHNKAEFKIPLFLWENIHH